ncbi:MAG: Eco57I restriction-modification methylase domain-containing protein, partial [Candidatus Binatia bacterium]
ANEKRFFHWELEFPEVFYGPRPGTRQVIERLEDAGFDAVIGNPPYDVLASEELGYDVSHELAFYEALSVYKPAIRGKKNLYKLFVCRGISAMSTRGGFSFIVPMPILGDDQAADVRRQLIQKTGLIAVEAFPQKDEPHNRVFPEAKLSTSVFVTCATPSEARFTIRTHPGRVVDVKSPTLEIASSEVLAFDPQNVAIPSCTQEDWDLAVRLVSLNKIHRMFEIAKSYQGEINETSERAKGTLTSHPGAPIVLRGANVCMYTVREPSQGEEVRLDVKQFLAGKRQDAKAFAHKHKRVGFQRSSPQNNFRRIIAAPIPRGSFCLDTISYVTDESSQIDLDLLLALLNSKILDWYFRLGSTNSKVNEYQFNVLPVPTLSKDPLDIGLMPLLERGHWAGLTDLLCEIGTEPGLMPRPVAQAIAEMSRRIQEIEAKRILKSRSERSHLAPESQPIQDAIDTLLFRCYGLSQEDAHYIEQRLGEML